MTTTFVTRETSRDRLATLFTSNGSWQAVYGYIPKDSTVRGQSPFMIITSLGTRQEMAGETYNPTQYFFSVVSFVLMNDKGSWTETNAEDKLDELDKSFRQVIRDNAGDGTGSDSYNFPDGQSRTDVTTIGGEQYRTEEWIIRADYYSGS